MIRHNDDVIDDDTERHRDACQRIKMYFDFKPVIKNKGNQNVCRQAYGDDEQVTQAAAGDPYEQKQYQDRDSGTDQVLVQFVFQLDGAVVGHFYGIIFRKIPCQLFNFFLHFGRQIYGVGVFFRKNIDIDPVQPVYPVVGRGYGFPVIEGGDVFQVNDLVADGFDRQKKQVCFVVVRVPFENDIRILLLRLCFYQYFPGVFAGVIGADSVGNVVSRHADVRQQARIVGQYPFEGYGSGDAHAFHSGHLGDQGGDVGLGKGGYILRASRSGDHIVQQQGLFRSSFPAVPEFPAPHFRHGNSVGQAGFDGTDDGGEVQLYGIDVFVFIDVQRDRSPPLPGVGRDVGKPFGAGERSFQFRGHLHFQQFRVRIRPGERYAQLLGTRRGIELEGKLRYQARSQQHQDDEYRID